MHANGFAISAKEKKSRRLLLLKRSVPLYLLILPSLILFDCVHVHSHVRRNYRL